MSTPGSTVATRQDDWAFAKALATAQFTIPRAYRDSPGDVLLALEYAKALGLSSITQVFNGVHVIDGRPGMSASMMQSLVIARGHSVVIETRDGAARCTVTRGDTGVSTAATFTDADAHRAGLLPAKAGSNWAKYPEDMLVARAVARACRRAAPDALMGVIYTPDELGADVVDGGAVGVESAGAPARQRLSGTYATEPPEHRPASPVSHEPDPAGVDVPLPEPDAAQPVLATGGTVDPDLDVDQAEWRAELDGAMAAGDAKAIAELITQASRRGWDELVQEAQDVASGLRISREPQQGFRE